MKFQAFPVAEAEGAILAHTVRAGGRVLKKGRVLTTEDIAFLAAAGYAQVTAARLEPDDMAEDLAAAAIARAFAGEGTRVAAAFTGRANLYAREAGLLLFEPSAIEAANLMHEAVTLATLPPYAVVAPDDMVATVKIIPFGAPKDTVTAIAAIAAQGHIRVAPFRRRTAALVGTYLPGQKPALREKTRTSLEARLAPLGGELVFETHVPHETGAVAAALREAAPHRADITFVMGASAISDRRDVVPAGIVGAGGVIDHFGMPVDPGNLLLLAHLDRRPVIGLPGCARSPKLNGFDFVLQRFFAGVPVHAHDLMRMGVGGLLQEIPGRPQPREGDDAHQMRAPRIAAIVLAAGLARRMGSNKLLAPVAGVPLLRRTVETALAAHARPVIVVTGHEEDKIKTALSGLDVQFVSNPQHTEGLSTSLRTGIQAVPASADGALVMLGDMPEIDSAVLDRLIAAFSPADGRAICVAASNGKRGNPVVWARRFFPEIETITGDTGAKHLIGAYEDVVCDVEGGEAVLHDIDTPEALDALRRRAQ